MAARRKKYGHAGGTRSFLPPIPTISIGNISWGGTGKTPVTDWLLNWAKTKNLPTAVLTRGYGGKPPHLPYPVSPQSPAAHSGDEARMLALLHPEALVLVDPVRVRAAKMALAGTLSPNVPGADHFLPELFLLDDGFQHLAMGRHINLALMDKDDLLPGPRSNWNRVIPAGTWREGENALQAASAFLVKCPQEEWNTLEPYVVDKLQPFGKPIFPFFLQSSGLMPLQGEKKLLSASSVSGPYRLLCGVGNPAQVRASVESFMGRSPAEELIFPDHHDYSKDIAKLAGSHLPIICTSKDLAKLEQLPLPPGLAILALEVSASFFSPAALPAQPDFSTWLADQITAQATAQTKTQATDSKTGQK